ncbi:MAG: glycoside hydrolase family 5 protein [Bryobacteraceae bacterium]|jgi:endoglucanase
MNSSSRFLALAALVACGLSAQMDPFAQIEKMRRGVNIVGYDPLWKDFAKARFHERHFQLIHEAGFQTVRVNLQAFGHMDAQNRLDPAWLKTLDWVVKNALANDLTVILDEHDYGFCGQHADTCRTKLLAFWQRVGEIYKDAPASVVFEILNEPNGQLTDEHWNALLAESLAVIRKTSPTRNVIVGPAFWNGIRALDKLDLPEDDRHLMVTVHYYLPMEFTHQGARWSKETAHLSGVTWGSDAEKQRVVDDFAGVQQWSKAHNRPILLGEFGAYDKGPLDARVLYTSWLARTAESLGWAWTYWQFDSDFIVWDMAKDAWVEPIRKALIP